MGTDILDSQQGTVEPREPELWAGDSPLLGRWRKVLEDLERRPYEPRDMVALWAHLLDSLTFLERTPGKRLKELKCSQAVVLEMMTGARDLLVEAMKGRFLAGAEKARAQHARIIGLASRASCFHHFAEPLVEWPWWLTKDGLLDILGDLEQHRRRQQRRRRPRREWE